MPLVRAPSHQIILALLLLLCVPHAAEAKHKAKLADPNKPSIIQPHNVPPAICGDGIVELGEQCDNGSGNSIGGSCQPNCMLARCGDGIVQPGESCDRGPRNGLPGSGCSTSCSIEIPLPVLPAPPGAQPGNIIGNGVPDILGLKPKSFINP